MGWSIKEVYLIIEVLLSKGFAKSEEEKREKGRKAPIIKLRKRESNLLLIESNKAMIP